MLSPTLSGILLGITGLCLGAFWWLAPLAVLERLDDPAPFTTLPSLVLLFLALFGYLLRLTLGVTGAQARHPSGGGRRGTWRLGVASVASLLTSSALLLVCVAFGGLFLLFRASEGGLVAVLLLLMVLCLGLVRWAWTREAKIVWHRRVARALLLLVGGAVVGGGLLVPHGMASQRSGNALATAMGRGESIRAAFASYAADRVDQCYPQAGQIHDYATLRALVNAYGGTLPVREAQAGFRFVSYATHAREQAPAERAKDETYVLILAPLKASVVKTLQITPEGMERMRAQEEPSAGQALRGGLRSSPGHLPGLPRGEL